MTNVANLSEFALFKDLPEEILDQITPLCKEETFAQGSFVFREGREADSLHFLVSGHITLRVNLTSRPDSVTVSVVTQPYESFGWSGIVAPHHYTASAHCEEDCKVLVIPGDQFMKILSKNPDAGFKVMTRITEMIASRLRNSRQALLKTL